MERPRAGGKRDPRILESRGIEKRRYDLVADSKILIPPPYSDAAGTESRRLVFLARYDGDDGDGDKDPFTGTDAGLLWVRVTIEDSPRSLETVIVE